MHSFFEQPDYAAPTRNGIHPFATPEAIAQRNRERIADGMLPTPEEREQAMLRIAAEVSKLPVLDERPMDEILGYDDAGLPT